MSLPVRRPGRRTQARGPARASAAGAAAARALGLAGIVVSLALLGLLVAGGLFAVGPTGLIVEGAHYTSLTQIRTALGLRPGTRLDLVTLRTSTLAARLRALPAVDAAVGDAAAVRVALPDRLIVTIRERRPIIVWQVGARRLLADASGRLLAEADGAVAPALPIVSDQRAADAGLSVGDGLDPLAFTAVRTLAAITPARLGSAAPSLALTLTDSDGFSLTAPAGWRAVFGLYTMNIRPPSIISRQVQCLTSLLAQAGEDHLATIYLSPGGGACGTYTTRGGTS